MDEDEDEMMKSLDSQGCGSLEDSHHSTVDQESGDLANSLDKSVDSVKKNGKKKKGGKGGKKGGKKGDKKKVRNVLVTVALLA